MSELLNRKGGLWNASKIWQNIAKQCEHDKTLQDVPVQVSHSKLMSMESAVSAFPTTSTELSSVSKNDNFGSNSKRLVWMVPIHLWWICPRCGPNPSTPRLSSVNFDGMEMKPRCATRGSICNRISGFITSSTMWEATAYSNLPACSTCCNKGSHADSLLTFRAKRSSFWGSPFRQHLWYAKSGVKQLMFCVCCKAISLDFKMVIGPERQQKRATDPENQGCLKQSSTTSGVLSATALITFCVHGFIAAPTSRTRKRGHRCCASTKREMRWSREPSEMCKECIAPWMPYSNLAHRNIQERIRTQTSKRKIMALRSIKIYQNAGFKLSGQGALSLEVGSMRAFSSSKSMARQGVRRKKSVDLLHLTCFCCECSANSSDFGSEVVSFGFLACACSKVHCTCHIFVLINVNCTKVVQVLRRCGCEVCIILSFELNFSHLHCCWRCTSVYT